MQIVEGGDQTLQPIAEVPENGSDSGSYQSQVLPVLRIHDILVYGSGSADPCLWLMDPDSDPDPASYVIDLLRRQQKLIYKKVFLLITFWRYIYIIFQREKVKKKSQNSRNQVFFSYYFCMMIEGSGAGSGSGRPRNIQIWIRNTG